ncbi:hypothetical protein [uncultured Cellulomonas sp.]|uniref:hypothetical protein n=1 Tax=uncultured Cellulomonas sp. TaxID=189682 RepID=UPI0028ECA390|nr:hypothetical protein [uncultured Cellulomonas sp.]
MSRRLLAVPVTAVLAWSLVACGGSAPEAPAEASDRPSATQEEEAVAEPAGFELTTDNLGEIAAAMQAAETYDTTMVTDVQGAQMTAQGQARVTDAGSELVMTMTSAQMASPLEIRLVGGQMYINMGELTGGKFWQLDPADTSNPLAASMGQSTGASATKSIEEILPALVSVTASGAAEQLDGVSAQPYEVVVDTSKMAGESAEQFAAAKAAGVEVPAQVTYTYWIGADRLPRKLVMEILGSHIEMTLSNWGGDVTIEAPPADQVTPAPAM